MLRVWGGGAFESKHFYNECSRLGITVTQDFLMACGDYPEDDDAFIDELRNEALYAVRLIRNQPSLVWWTGDNENAVMGSDTDENYKGRRSAYDGIAPVLYKEDPYRRFLPSSPYGGSLYASNTVGTTHNTQYLSQFFSYVTNGDLSSYKEELKKYRARFIAEEPQMGAASSVSLRRFMTESDIFDGEKMWLYHTKTNPALPLELFDYLKIFTEGVLGKFEDGKDRLFKLRYMQYEWIRVVMEQAQRERALCSGIIFWMMNDCWPSAAGWSLIDYYSLPKDAFYSFKRLSKPVFASIDKYADEYRFYVINNKKACVVSARVKALNYKSSNVRELARFSFVSEAYSSKAVYSLNEKLGDNEVLIFDISTDGSSDRAFYKDGALKITPAKVDITDNRDGTLTLKSECYLHAVTLTADAVFEDNCFSLMPRESRTVSYRLRSDGKITAEAYTLK
jgi:beta-mannosidase